MSRYRTLLFVCLLATASSYAANVRLQVVGLEGELQRNVRARLSTIGPDEVSAEGRFRARVDDAIRRGLRALGYYDPQINFEYRLAENGGRPLLLVTVTPGEPVKIAGTDVLLQGDASSDSDFLQLRRRSVLNHGDYDDFKRSLNNLALRKGYFDAHYYKSQLGVIRETREAFWDIDYDGGTRYRFGDVHFQGSQIDEAYPRNLIPFKRGDEYTSEDLGEFNRRLSATGWFTSAVVSPNFAAGKTDKILPLDAVVTPRAQFTGKRGGIFHRRGAVLSDHVAQTVDQRAWAQSGKQPERLCAGTVAGFQLQNSLAEKSAGAVLFVASRF